MTVLSSRSQRIGLAIFLVVYVIAGVFTTVQQLTKLPLSDSLFMDFGFYDAALQRVRAGGDMYAIREVGEAYLYPPPALLTVELADFLPGKLARGASLAVLDVVMACAMVFWVARRYALRLIQFLRGMGPVWVKAGQLMGMRSDLLPVEYYHVVFTLPAQTLNRIRTQMAAGDLTVLAMDQDNTTVLGQGTLAVIDNQIDTTTGTIKIKATFPNTDLHLWPGQFVNARLLLTVRKGSAVVPASVIQRGPEGAFAFVIKDDQTVEVRPVKVAQIEQGEAIIEDGLHAGERVVVDGQYKLQKGSRIKTAAAAGKPEIRKPKSEGSPKPDTRKGAKS